jgi:hypothetical protein
VDGHEPNKVIAFKKGFAPEDDYSISKGQLKKLVKALLAQKSNPSTHSYHGELTPSQVEMIISHLMYTKGADSINLTINKEEDGYHLGLTIHDIQDEPSEWDDDSLYL